MEDEFKLSSLGNDANIKHVKRAQNKNADRAANMAMDTGDHFTSVHSLAAFIQKALATRLEMDAAQEFAIVAKTGGGFLSGPELAAILVVVYGVQVRGGRITNKERLAVWGRTVPKGDLGSGSAKLDAVLDFLRCFRDQLASPFKNGGDE